MADDVTRTRHRALCTEVVDVVVPPSSHEPTQGKSRSKLGQGGFCLILLGIQRRCARATVDPLPLHPCRTPRLHKQNNHDDDDDDDNYNNNNKLELSDEAICLYDFKMVSSSHLECKGTMADLLQTLPLPQFPFGYLSARTTKRAAARSTASCLQQMICHHQTEKARQ